MRRDDRSLERFGAIRNRTQVLLTDLLACVSEEVPTAPHATNTASAALMSREAEFEAELGRWNDEYLELSTAIVTKTLVKRPRDL